MFHSALVVEFREQGDTAEEYRSAPFQAVWRLVM